MKTNGRAFPPPRESEPSESNRAFFLLEEKLEANTGDVTLCTTNTNTGYQVVVFTKKAARVSLASSYDRERCHGRPASGTVRIAASSLRTMMKATRRKQSETPAKTAASWARQTPARASIRRRRPRRRRTRSRLRPILSLSLTMTPHA